MAKKLTVQALQDIEKETYAAFVAARDATECRREAYKRWYQLYRSAAAPKKDKWKSNVFVSLTSSIINTFLPRIQRALLGDGNSWFIIKARKRNKDKKAEKTAEIYTQLLQVYMRQINIYVKMAGAFLYALLFGNCYLKIYWKLVKDTETVTETVKKTKTIKDEETGEDIEVDEETEEERKIDRVIADRPEVDVILPHDGINPTNVKEFYGKDYFFHRSWISREALLKNPTYSKNKLFIENIKAAKGTPQNSSAEDLRNAIGEVFLPSDKIEVIEAWKCGRVTTLADGKIIRHGKPNKGDKNPFVNICNYPEPNCVEGTSELESFETLQQWVNDSTNIRIDNLKLVLNQMYSVIRGSKINPIQLRARPGGVIELDAHDHLRPLTSPEIKASAYEEVNHIRGLIQVITGITDYTTGASQDNSLTKTAAGINSIIAEANQRFALKINIWRTTVMQEMLYQIIELIQAYLTREDIAKILDIDPADAIEPEDIDFTAMYEFEIPAYLSTDERDMEYQAIRALMALVKEMPPSESAKLEIDTDRLMKRMATVLGKDDLVKEKPPAPAMPPQPQAGPAGIPGAGAPAPLPIPAAAAAQAAARPAPAAAGKVFTPDQVLRIAQALKRDPKVIQAFINKGGNPAELAMEAYKANMAAKGAR